VVVESGVYIVALADHVKLNTGSHICSIETIERWFPISTESPDSRLGVREREIFWKLQWLAHVFVRCVYICQFLFIYIHRCRSMYAYMSEFVCRIACAQAYRQAPLALPTTYVIIAVFAGCPRPDLKLYHYWIQILKIKVYKVQETACHAAAVLLASRKALPDNGSVEQDVPRVPSLTRKYAEDSSAFEALERQTPGDQNIRTQREYRHKSTIRSPNWFVPKPGETPLSLI
jgi:hypothetical protein